MTSVHGSGTETENSLQGGYAEQLVLYDELHAHLGMDGVVGNRSGIIDGPGFLGIPCLQLVTRSPFPAESPLDRLGLLQALLPRYRILTLERPEESRKRGAGSPASPHLSAAQLQDLRKSIANFAVMRNAGLKR